MKRSLFRAFTAALAVLMAVSLCGCGVEISVATPSQIATTTGTGGDPWDDVTTTVAPTTTTTKKATTTTTKKTTTTSATAKGIYVDWDSAARKLQVVQKYSGTHDLVSIIKPCAPNSILNFVSPKIIANTGSTVSNNLSAATLIYGMPESDWLGPHHINNDWHGGTHESGGLPTGYTDDIVIKVDGKATEGNIGTFAKNVTITYNNYLWNTTTKEPFLKEAYTLTFDGVKWNVDCMLTFLKAAKNWKAYNGMQCTYPAWKNTIQYGDGMPISLDAVNGNCKAPNWDCDTVTLRGNSGHALEMKLDRNYSLGKGAFIDKTTSGGAYTAAYPHPNGKAYFSLVNVARDVSAGAKYGWRGTYRFFNEATGTNATNQNPAPDASQYTDTPYAIRSEATALKLTQDVLDRSILTVGDNSRVAEVIKKAIRGEDVLIGFIGGSITQGSSASTASNKYAERFYNWFKSTYPKANVTMRNAGLGATDSLMAVHRVDDHLLKYEPDLVIVDFSVNDPYEAQYSESYEGLMRKILKSGAAVIGLQMMKQDGTNAYEQHAPISRLYNIPTVSYKNALWPNTGTKLYEWSAISPDNIHPNDTGHAIVSELLINYINVVRSKLTKASAPSTTLPSPKTANGYESGILLNATNSTPSSLGGFASSSGTPQFPNGWATSNGGGKTFKLTVEDAKELSLLYWCQSGASGTAVVKVDGTEVATVKSDNSASWNYAVTQALVDSKTAGDHTVEITCTGQFWILGILKS